MSVEQSSENFDWMFKMLSAFPRAIGVGSEEVLFRRDQMHVGSDGQRQIHTARLYWSQIFASNKDETSCCRQHLENFNDYSLVFFKQTM